LDYSFVADSKGLSSTNFYVNGPKDAEFGRITQNNGHYAFKVSNFDTNRQPVCDFLLVINTNLHPISHRFQVTADHWSNLCFQQGEPINLQP